MSGQIVLNHYNFFIKLSKTVLKVNFEFLALKFDQESDIVIRQLSFLFYPFIN